MPHSIPQSNSKDPVDHDSTLPDAPPASLERPGAEDDSRSGSNVVASNANVKLEDLFDEDDDEEFASSGASKEDAPSSSQPPSPP